MRRLPVISTNGLDRYRTCQRMYRFVYIDGYEPIERTEPLDFGTHWHDALEAYWFAILRGNGEDPLAAGLAALDASRAVDDPYLRAEARVLFVGYHARWIAEDVAVPVSCVEAKFTLPISGTGWQLTGRLDVGRVDGVMEHKSTTSDISMGASYWSKLRLNAQVSNYAFAAPSLGLDASLCHYDVVRRPEIKPAKATPIEKREYTQPKDKACPLCKKKSAPPAPHDVDLGEGRVVQCADGRVVTDPGGRLYASMRADDEPVDVYAKRLHEDVVARPDDYFRRAVVVRSAHELDEAAEDLRASVRQIDHSTATGMWPRNPGQCFRFGKFCPFFDVCSGTASLDDPMKFKRRATT